MDLMGEFAGKEVRQAKVDENRHSKGIEVLRYC